MSETRKRPNKYTLIVSKTAEKGQNVFEGVGRCDLVEKGGHRVYDE
jgi:hypothetical protein